MSHSKPTNNKEIGKRNWEDSSSQSFLIIYPITLYMVPSHSFLNFWCIDHGNSCSLQRVNMSTKLTLGRRWESSQLDVWLPGLLKKGLQLIVTYVSLSLGSSSKSSSLASYFYWLKINTEEFQIHDNTEKNTYLHVYIQGKPRFRAIKSILNIYPRLETNQLYYLIKTW